MEGSIFFVLLTTVPVVGISKEISLVDSYRGLVSLMSSASASVSGTTTAAAARQSRGEGSSSGGCREPSEGFETHGQEENEEEGEVEV